MNAQHKSQTDSGLRKAAILVTSLDRASADTVLEQLDPPQARRVRQLMVEMDRIDPKEQRRVIDEFCRFGPMVPQRQPAGIELDGQPARKLSMPAAAQSQPTSLPPGTRPFHFLQDAEAEKLARVLQNERPQTIALVLSHLPSERASRVLSRLPGSLQAEILRRLVDLEETDPTILREVEQALQSRLSQQVHMQRRRVAGIKAVEDIIAASDGPTGSQILRNLAANDRTLAERLSPPAERPSPPAPKPSPPAPKSSPPAPKFEDLTRLDDAALDAVLEAAEPEVALTALVGAPEELIDRILRRFPEPQAKTIRHQLDHPGPLRLSDVEEARRQIAELARRPAMQRQIQLAQD